MNLQDNHSGEMANASVPPLDDSRIFEIVRRHYPDTEAVYLFGSHAAGEAWPGSDVDLALLLPFTQARREGLLAMSDCAAELSQAVHAEVDLVNLREVPTILQIEIVHKGHRLGVGDALVTNQFEMQVLKNYQNLSEERAEIIAQGLETGRFYQP